MGGASVRFEKRLNVSINLRKLSIFSQVFLNQSEALGMGVEEWCSSLKFPPGLGFVCFVVINPRVLSANRVDFGLLLLFYILYHILLNFHFTPPPSETSKIIHPAPLAPSSRTRLSASF